MGAFIFTQDPHGEADEGPQVNCVILSAKMVSQIMNLRVAIVTRGNDIVSACGVNLIKFYLTILSAFVFSARLQKPTPASTAVVIGPIGGHIDEIFFTHHRLGYIA